MNLQWTEALLEQTKKTYPEHEHIVVRDEAGFHPKDIGNDYIPEDVYVLALRPYSQELNPIEILWAIPIQLLENPDITYHNQLIF